MNSQIAGKLLDEFKGTPKKKFAHNIFNIHSSKPLSGHINPQKC
jgi:putative heme iron utilization protein